MKAKDEEADIRTETQKSAMHTEKKDIERKKIRKTNKTENQQTEWGAEELRGSWGRETSEDEGGTWGVCW